MEGIRLISENRPITGIRGWAAAGVTRADYIPVDIIAVEAPETPVAVRTV